MISDTDVAMIEHIVDTSRVVDILNDGMTRSSRGRPSNTSDLRLFNIGALLANQKYRTFRTRDIHTTLTTDLSRTAQEHLGIITIRDGHEMMLKETALNTVVRRVYEKLGYGYGTHPELDDTERQRRLDVMTAASDALLDVFLELTTSTYYAIDSSGVWSWAVSSRKRPNVDELDAADEDDAISSADPDARWGVKTAKDGSRETVFGYHLHGAITVAGRTADSRHQDQDAEPRIIARLGITPAPADIVDVTLSIIDRLHGRITDILTDSHYHYKAIDRWLIPTLERNVRNHHDLRKDEVGIKWYSDIAFLGGQGFCASCPTDALTTKPLGPEPTDEARQEAIQKVEIRSNYRMKVIKPLDANLNITYQCPAAAGLIGCPNRPESMIVANRHAQPINTNPIEPNATGELPTCCTNTTFQLTLPMKIAKTHQRHLWQSKKWQATYNKRSHVEGFFGNIKNDATENVHRGLHRHIGIMWNHYFLTLASVNYNLRTVRTWHETTGYGDPSHPLLADITPTPKNRFKQPVRRGPRQPRWKKAA
jgi:hypothetical protein